MSGNFICITTLLLLFLKTINSFTFQNQFYNFSFIFSCNLIALFLNPNCPLPHNNNSLLLPLCHTILLNTKENNSRKERIWGGARKNNLSLKKLKMRSMSHISEMEILWLSFSCI